MSKAGMSAVCEERAPDDLEGGSAGLLYTGLVVLVLASSSPTRVALLPLLMLMVLGANETVRPEVDLLPTGLLAP